MSFLEYTINAPERGWRITKEGNQAMGICEIDALSGILLDSQEEYEAFLSDLQSVARELEWEK